jgi:transposase
MHQTAESSAQKNENICRMLARVNPDGTRFHSFREIRRSVRCGKDKFTNVREYWEEHHEVPPAVMGRPRKIDENMIHQVQLETLTNPMRSSRDVAAHTTEELGVSISRSSIDRIRHDLHFHFLPKKHRTALTPEHIQNRKQFSRDLKQGAIYGMALALMMIIFSDESRFCMNSDSRWCWRRAGELEEGIFQDTVKFPVSIMVWGAIGVGFKSKLMFIENTLGAEGYIAMLLASGFIAACNQLFGLGAWWFMQDGAPCHTAQSSLSWLRDRVRLLFGWPANSPDLNPIEMIWGIMKRRLNTRRAKTRAEFVEIVQEVWDSLDVDRVINPLVQSFTMRIDLVNRLGGKSIQGHLHDHMENIGRMAIGPFEDLPYDWTPDLDDLLMIYEGEFGHAWKKIGRLMGLKPVQVKYRYGVLQGQDMAREHPPVIP